MKKTMPWIKILIVAINIIYGFIVIILPATFVIGATEGGATFQNYLGYVIEFFIFVTPFFLLFLFSLILLNQYCLFKKGELPKESFRKQVIILSVIITIQICAVIGFFVYMDSINNGNLMKIQ